MALAIFDLDNTLIEGDSDHAWGEFLVENNIVNKEEYKKANDKFLQDYQSGQLDIFEYLEFALKPLAENTPEDLMKLRKDFFEQKIKPILLPKGFELLKTHREKGDFLLIITATNRFVTELIADAFEVDDLIATGGTATATADLCRELGATDIHTLCLIDLPHLGGSKKLAEKYGEVITIIDY